MSPNILLSVVENDTTSAEMLFTWKRGEYLVSKDGIDSNNVYHLMTVQWCGQMVQQTANPKVSS